MRYIPHKYVTMRTGDKPFYNGYLRRLKRQLNRLHRKTKTLNTIIAWDHYKMKRNFYFREVKRCKTEFCEQFYESFDDQLLSPKQYYAVAKKLFPFKGTNSDSIPSLFDEKGSIISNDFDKACAFNNYFSKASYLEVSNACLPNDDNPFPGISPLGEIVIDEQEGILDINQGYSPDNISPRLIKYGGQSIAKPLTKLFNKSLQYSKVPIAWKQANVLPLYKKESKNILSNYRPVSLLSVIGKIMERILFKHIYNHFQKKFLLSLWQSGFRPGSSTFTQLLEMYNSFCKAVDDNKEIRVVLIRCGIRDWFTN